MFYEYPLTVPASTDQADPTVSRIQIIKGVISNVEIFFPEGCNSLVQTTVSRGLRQLWPTPPAVSLSDNDYHINFREDFPILEPPYELILRGWSSDTIYPHTIVYRFLVNAEPVLQRAILDEYLFGELVPILEIN